MATGMPVPKPEPVARVRQWLDELMGTDEDAAERLLDGRAELTRRRDVGAVGRCYAMLRALRRGDPLDREANEALWSLAVFCVEELMLTIDRESAHLVRDVEIGGDFIADVAERRGEPMHITAGRLQWARNGIRLRLLEALDRSVQERPSRVASGSRA